MVYLWGLVVSAWRAKALELFPERRQQIEYVESVGMLWIYLWDDVSRYYGESAETTEPFISAAFEYLRWCLHAQDADTYNAACIGFCESLATFATQTGAPIYGRIVSDLATKFNHLEIRELAPCFAIPLGPSRVDTLLADIATARKGQEKSQKKRRATSE